MLSAAFAKRVERLRKRKGVTQQKLASATGLTESWLWRLQDEQKPRTITLALIMRLCHGLDVTPDELLNGLPVPTKHHTRPNRDSN